MSWHILRKYEAVPDNVAETIEAKKWRGGFVEIR